MPLSPLDSERLFDTGVRISHLNTVRNKLHLSEVSLDTATTDTAERPTIGIEIEMTWIQAFRDMQARWLNSGDRPLDYDNNSPTHREFTAQYDRNDRRLRPILQSITPVIPRVGFDSYWEFSFRPTKDTNVTNAELSTLYEADVLFDDIAYPTHMTIANIPTERDASAILCLLEQNGGSNPDRINSALTSKKGSWARKGTGGLRLRTADELEGDDTSAYEFRTLVTTSPEQMQRLLRLGQELAHTCLTHPRAWLKTRETVEDSLKTHGLPVKSWGYPKDNAEVWKKYSEKLLGSVAE